LTTVGMLLLKVQTEKKETWQCRVCSADHKDRRRRHMYKSQNNSSFLDLAAGFLGIVVISKFAIASVCRCCHTSCAQLFRRQLFQLTGVRCSLLFADATVADSVAMDIVLVASRPPVLL
jgi:hypothetical protein